MSFLTGLFGAADVVSNVGDTMDRLFTSDEERLEAERELASARGRLAVAEAEIVSRQNLAQAAILHEEARRGDRFQSGWRPMIGWICAVALGYQFLLHPLLAWLSINRGWQAPPAPDAGLMFSIVTGMLGIAGMRSFDKLKGTDTFRPGG